MTEHRSGEAPNIPHTCPFGAPGFFPNCNACVIAMQRGLDKGAWGASAPLHRPSDAQAPLQDHPGAFLPSVERRTSDPTSPRPQGSPDLGATNPRRMDEEAQTDWITRMHEALVQYSVPQANGDEFVPATRRVARLLAEEFAPRCVLCGGMHELSTRCSKCEGAMRRPNEAGPRDMSAVLDREGNPYSVDDLVARHWGAGGTGHQRALVDELELLFRVRENAKLVEAYDAAKPRSVPARLSGQERAVAESDEPTPYDASFGRLSDIIDEAFGMQPVMTDAEILTFLEQSLAKQRRESPDHLAEARLAIRRAFDCNTPASMFEALSDALTHINAAALSSSTDTETKR